MHKVVGFSLFLILAAGLGFGDDAKVLPQGVLRIRTIPSFSMVDQTYDKDGNASDGVKGSIIGMSGSAELGVTSAITIGFQWAPGYYVANSIDRISTDLGQFGLKAGNISAIGPADLQIGGKFLLVGTGGFLPNEQIRLAVTPGIQLPLDAYDAETEADNAKNGKTFRPQSASSHQSVGFGSKLDADYLINNLFYVNAHGEALYFLDNESITFATALSHSFLSTSLAKTKSTYGLQTKFELEPHARLVLVGDTSLNAGLPVTYYLTTAGTATKNGTSSDIDATSELELGPNVSVLTMVGPLPVEMEAQYFFPLLARSIEPQNTFAIQIKLFAKLY